MSADESIRALMYRWSLLELRLIKENPDGSGLPYRDVMYLNIIDFLGAVTVSELAVLTGVTKSTVTTRISRLERNGMVTKVRSDEDARIKYITLSDRAKELYAKEREHIQAVVEELTEQFGNERMEETSDVLEQISYHFEERSFG